MSRLYEIADDLLDIEEALIESGGELTPEIEAALDAVEGAWADKVDRLVHVILNAKANADARRAESDRLAHLAREAERTVDGLKSYLKAQMERTGKRSIETEFCKVRVQKNSRPSIRWKLDMATLPNAYRKVHPIELDGTFAYNEYRNGSLPEEFEVVTGSHVRIK